MSEFTNQLQKPVDAYEKAPVQFFHTSRLEITKFGIAPACTIAIRKEGSEFRYGVAICSKQDNFSRKFGRELATERLEQGFGTLVAHEELKNMTDKEAIKFHLYNLVESIVLNTRRWKGKVTRFNLEHKTK